jgi:hypothetical protein
MLSNISAIVPVADMKLRIAAIKGEVADPLLGQLLIPCAKN